jgi:DNA-directed RNA polymerase specialized sigma24 family protein
MTASLETLFERFRRDGDIDAVGEVFDRTAPALTRVAQHLCGAQDAGDVVQES